ncbi:MAG: type II toxin-antitoxin system VapB family antitoxin [Chloroflexota bacterium]
MGPMRRHTTLNLDDHLVADAAKTLGTRGTTETVHAALREVVARQRRRALVELELAELTPQALELMRAPRTFQSSPSRRR